MRSVMNSKIIKIFISIILLIGAVALVSLTQQYLDQTRQIADNAESSRGFDSDEENITWMHVEGRDAIDGAFKNQSASILNQIYSQHYKLHKQIIRSAELKSEVSRSGDTYSFTLFFPEYGNHFRTEVKVRNLQTGDYDISIKEVNS